MDQRRFINSCRSITLTTPTQIEFFIPPTRNNRFATVPSTNTPTVLVNASPKRVTGSGITEHRTQQSILSLTLLFARLLQRCRFRISVDPACLASRERRQHLPRGSERTEIHADLRIQCRLEQGQMEDERAKAAETTEFRNRRLGELAPHNDAEATATLVRIKGAMAPTH